MKTTFKVPLHLIGSFADGLEETELRNEIQGSEDGKIIVQIQYSKSEFEELQQIIDIVGDPDEEDSEDDDQDDD